MKKRNWNILWALLLCICLVFGQVPATAAAAGAFAEEDAEAVTGEEMASAGLVQAFTVYEEAEGAEKEEAAGSLLDQLSGLLGGESGELLSRLKELLGSSSGAVEKLKELLGGSSQILDILKTLVKELLKDPSSAVGKIRDLIDMLSGNMPISYMYLEVIKPEPGKACTPRQLIPPAEEEANYTVERAVYVKDGAESEAARVFAPLEEFQLRVTFKAKEGKHFGSQLYTSYLADLESVTVEKLTRETATLLYVVKALNTKGVIEKVSLTLEGPLGGQNSSDFRPICSTLETANYYIGGVEWCDAKGEPLEDEVSFVTGKTYYMIIYLNPDDGCWFVDGKTAAEITGGELVGKLRIESEQYDGVLQTNAQAVVSVTAEEAQEGLIQRINLSFTKPEEGTEFVVKGKELAPRLALEIPEDSPYAFADAYNAWFCLEHGEPVEDGVYEVKKGESFNCYTILKANASHTFYTHPLITIEDADEAKVDALSEDGTTIGIFFSFYIPQPEEPDVVDLTTVDTMQQPGEGGSVNVEITNLDGTPSECGGETRGGIDFGSGFQEGTKFNMTAVPDAGYTFAGWYESDELKVHSGEGGWYYPDRLLSKNATYSYVTKAGETLYICAVFDGGAAKVKTRYVYQCEKNEVYRYTTNKDVVKKLRDEGWSYKKVFRVPAQGTEKAYWVYNKSTKRYRYTNKLSYAKKMKNAGNKAGVAFYQSEKRSVPIYELVKGNTYFYTMKKSEAKARIKDGWTYKQVAFYGEPKA